MLGAIFGDIVGSVYEGRNNRTKDFPLLIEESTFTDDTVMTIAIGDALLEALEQDYDEAKIEKTIITKMQAYGRAYPYRGYGGMFAKWLEAKDPQPYHSFGNGSAMRVSSVGWLFDTLEEVEHYAQITARVTHNHPEGIKGAKAIAACIYLARKKKSKEEIYEYITKTYQYDLHESLDEIRSYYSFDVTCQGSVPQAIRAFYESENYEDAIRGAISIGGDSDTIACMTGGIAKAYYGMPEDLKNMAKKRLDKRLLKVVNAFESYLLK